MAKALTIGCIVLALVAAVYLPSLGGDWVWDDVYQLRDNPAITQPWVLLTHDVWGPTGFADAHNTPVYRPLAMASHSLGQMLWRGPLVERLASLALHLGIVVLLAALAMTLGADSSWPPLPVSPRHPSYLGPIRTGANGRRRRASNPVERAPE